ncbi:hypothetical protein H5410_047260 [Solanum commersonii]|uniref:Uncharacterized protein n=1 Tax=Solanum commersonii TaxID=4109 RepID=A0A9J5XGM4_SOLCO|nr:hypothetical protein H5410_047260 [Solanum commersonii]
MSNLTKSAMPLMSSLSLLPSLVGHHLTQLPDSIPELSISDLSLGLHFWCIGYPLILWFNIPPSGTTSNNSSWRHDLKDTHKHELEMNSIERKEYEKSEIVPKCYSILIVDVARFTPIIRTLQTRLHRHSRTLKLWALIPNWSCLEPTP